MILKVLHTSNLATLLYRKRKRSCCQRITKHVAVVVFFATIKQKPFRGVPKILSTCMLVELLL